MPFLRLQDNDRSHTDEMRWDCERVQLQMKSYPILSGCDALNVCQGLEYRKRHDREPFFDCYSIGYAGVI
jgi:hypothetical protein